jgi:hypothetical protein
MALNVRAVPIHPAPALLQKQLCSVLAPIESLWQHVT